MCFSPPEDLDVGQRSVTGTLGLGKSPEGVSISPDGRTVTVAVEESDSVALIDTASRKILADIKVWGENPDFAPGAAGQMSRTTRPSFGSFSGTGIRRACRHSGHAMQDA